MKGVLTSAITAIFIMTACSMHVWKGCKHECLTHMLTFAIPATLVMRRLTAAAIP